MVENQWSNGSVNASLVVYPNRGTIIHHTVNVLSLSTCRYVVRSIVLLERVSVSMVLYADVQLSLVCWLSSQKARLVLVLSNWISAVAHLTFHSLTQLRVKLLNALQQRAMNKTIAAAFRRRARFATIPTKANKRFHFSNYRS